MSLHILDTDHISLHQRGHPRVVSRLKAFASNQLAVTVITLEEQLRGRFSQIRQQGIDPVLAYDQLRATAEYFCDLPVLRFDQAAHREFTRLRSLGIRIGTHDLRIAAIALTQSATLITRNQRDFGQVPGIRLEDWSLPA